MIRFLISALVGYAASKLFHDPAHADEFPELGRYAIGIVAVAIALVLTGDYYDVEDVLFVASSVGAGVALARIADGSAIR